MNRSHAFLLSVIVALCASNLNAANIIFEDFEDATLLYTPSSADALDDIGNRDYYGRTNLTDLPSDISYSNVQGTNFYAAQDMDSALPTPSDSVDLDFSVNITNYADLGFSIFVAEDDSNDGAEDWDSAESLTVQYQIDGGGFLNLLAFEAGGDEVNEQPQEDTDFDEVGDGTALTDAFTQFLKSIPGSGNTLDVKISIAMNAGDEDVAIDSVAVTGTLVPEPTSAGLLGVALLALGCIRRRI